MLFACVYLSIVSDINTCTENKSGCVKHFTVEKSTFASTFSTIHMYMYSGITSGRVLKGGVAGRGGGGGGAIEYLSLNMNVMQVI